MKTFKEFLLMESPISNGKPKWDGETDKSMGGVAIANSNLTEFDFDYSSFDLKGSFICSGNRLTSLEGSPKACMDFYCSDNYITNLVGSPEIVRGSFNCNGNDDLISLKGIPEEIEYHMYFRDCPNLFEVSPLLNSKVGGTIHLSREDRTIADILNKYKNNPKNLIKMLAELKKIDKRYC